MKILPAPKQKRMLKLVSLRMTREKKETEKKKNKKRKWRLLHISFR